MANQYDLVIVGAGIHGAAVARQAVDLGLNVCVLEQYSGPARATSSRSSKLIHGGLRYLETLSINLVRECLQDRKRLLEHYPDLVHMQKFYIPIYKQTSRSRFVIRAGLSLYGLLGGLNKYSRYQVVPRSQWPHMDGIKQDDLLAVFQYWDAQTDDAKLTARLLEESAERGANIRYNARLSKITQEPEGITASIVDTQLNSQSNADAPEESIKGRYLINAAGPWCNKVLEQCMPPQTGLPVELVQGTHIELPGRLQHGVYYLESPKDRRAIFAMPWYDRILFGTTETVYHGDPANVEPTAEEIDYLLQVYNHYFTQAPLTRDDIIDAWAGLRVLPKSEDDPFSRSRDTIFLCDNEEQPKIVSIFGGKLTSHFSTAKKLLKKLNNNYG